MGASAFEREIHISFSSGMPQAHFQKHYDKRHAGQRPFDFEIFCQNCFFGLEAKHAADRLPLRRFHPHQREALEKVVDNGGFAYLLVRIENTKLKRNKFQAFAITPHRLLSLAEALGKSSVNAKDLAEGGAGLPGAEFIATRMKYEKGYGWNYPIFFEQQVRRVLELRDQY